MAIKQIKIEGLKVSSGALDVSARVLTDQSLVTAAFRFQVKRHENLKMLLEQVGDEAKRLIVESFDKPEPAAAPQ